MSQMYPCWVDGIRHDDDQFPRIAGVPITYGGMGRECRKVYDALDPVKRRQVRRDGIARWEALTTTR